MGNGPNMLDSSESQPKAPSFAMAKKKSPAEKPKTAGPNMAEAERVIHLRKVLGYPTSNSFAVFLGVSPTRWNNVENGTPLSRDLVFRLVRAIPGLTSDWLYFGNSDGMPFELARRLGVAGPPPGKRNTA
jgi:hypothetical protein